MKFVEREEFSNLRSSLLSQERASSVRLILGGAGIGKTTLVKALRDTLKQERWRIYSSHDTASFVSLSQFLEGLLKWIARVGGAANPARSDMPFDERFYHALSEVTNRAPVLIILDGLDEIQLDNMGTDQLAEVARIIRSLPGSHLLLVSRTYLHLVFDPRSPTRKGFPRRVALRGFPGTVPSVGTSISRTGGEGQTAI